MIGFANGHRATPAPSAERSTGTRALRHVEREDGEADLGPSTRMTFVAPRLPDPCLRRSMPFDLPGDVRRRNRPEQIRGDDRSDERHARCDVSSSLRHPALRRITMRSGLPVNPQNDAESVVQIADVVLLHEIGRVAEDRDRRRMRLDLRRVVELHSRGPPPAAADAARAARRASRSPRTS